MPAPNRRVKPSLAWRRKSTRWRGLWNRWRPGENPSPSSSPWVPWINAVHEFLQSPHWSLTVFFFFSLIFIIFRSLDFLFNHFEQRETFGEAGQKPELGSREATAVSAVAPTSLTSNRPLLPNIDITKLGFHLFCTSLLCCWKSNQPPSISHSGLWVSVDSIDL